ncbi:MAG TPA: RtcB family protein [Candidatus Nanoarchaeia archaeon]|nr:RtcB family protein [Candidatus Nanoarchaeia archaeon]
MAELKKKSDTTWEIPKSGTMKVPALVFASEKLLNDIKRDKTLEQIKNVASLPGIIKNAIALSDAHQGYGFPIGGVAAFDMEKGIISPGGVGYDINCGVRLLSTNVSVKEFMKKRKEILHDIFRAVPAGVGRGGIRYTREEIIEVLKKGAEWAVEKGMGTKEDLSCTEENGRIKNADPKDVSQRAIARGLPQLGTLGAGNHFLEIEKIDRIFDEKIAKAFGLDKENITIMIHCGSRGLGHQVASDYIQIMEKKYGFANLPDRELINAPINSELGQKYLSAMNCAVNFAFCNRQIIMDSVRKVLKKYFPKSKANLVYDVCHNIAKMEEHIIDGKKQMVCIHRKGATRSFGPGRKEIPEIYRKIGQPILIPGSMGTASYVLVGTKKAEEVTFGSTAHGSGRVESRSQAKRELTAEQIRKEMSEKDILVETLSSKALVEEAPEVYKDIDEVVRVSHEAGIGNIVARLVPLAVMKG